MSEFKDEHGHPIGAPMPGWTTRELPSRTKMTGRFCTLEPLNVQYHARDLFESYGGGEDGRNWTYLNSKPASEFEAFENWLKNSCLGDDPLFHAIVDRKTEKAVGVAAYMRIDRVNGCIEVGSINYAPALKQTAAGTEAMYLMMKRVFDELGYRRYEWKCDSLNAGSKRAASRYGFTFEGVFRQALVTKGRNRDTAWFSIVDQEWPAIKTAFEEWLPAENMSEDGRQKKPLAAFMPE